MIWDADPTDTPPARRELVAQVAAEIARVAPPDGESQRLAQDVAWAVAAYLERQPGACCVESPRVRLLICRALSASGAPEIARRLLLRNSSVVRCAESPLAPGAPAVTLDLGQLLAPGADRTELALFAGLACLLEAVAENWDASAGHGVLELRDLRRAAGGVLGCAPRHRRAGALAAETKAFCARKLTAVQQARGWRASPLVIEVAQ